MLEVNIFLVFSKFSIVLMRIIHTILIAVAIQATMVLGWRSMTHQGFGQISMEMPEITDKLSFILGCSAPDAFRPPFLLWSFHNFKFAGFQYLYALEAQKNNVSYNGFEPLSYSLGYAAHLAQDLVGHDKRGFVASGSITEPIIELALESYVHNNPPYPQSILPFPKESVDFVHDATHYFKEKTGQHPISRCGVKFDEYMFNVLSDVEEFVYLPNDKKYKDRLVKYDPYGSGSFGETETHIQEAFGCAKLATKFVVDKLISSENPEETEAATRDYVNSLFVSGKCTPSGLVREDDAEREYERQVGVVMKDYCEA